jgi:hypothetical protein
MGTPPIFSPLQVLTSNVMNLAGMWKVNSYTSTAGASQITCANAFNADFDLYRITIYGGSTSATADINFRWGSLTTGYYWGLSSVSFGAATVISLNGSNVGNWQSVGRGTTLATAGSFDVYGANGDQKWFTGLQASPLTTGVMVYSGGYHGSTTTQTDFNLTLTTGTFNAGVIVTVYGYTK